MKHFSSERLLLKGWPHDALLHAMLCAIAKIVEYERLRLILQKIKNAKPVTGAYAAFSAGVHFKLERT